MKGDGHVSGPKALSDTPGGGYVDQAAVASAVEHAVANAEAEFQRIAHDQQTAAARQLQAAFVEAEATRATATREIEVAAAEAEAATIEAETQAAERAVAEAQLEEVMAALRTAEETMRRQMSTLGTSAEDTIHRRIGQSLQE